MNAVARAQLTFQILTKLLILLGGGGGLHWSSKESVNDMHISLDVVHYVL